MTSSDGTHTFRFLLHSRDGCIPHLTPRLVDQIFCQNEDDPANEEWKWYRRHVILGIAAKDTCITPVYSNKRKRDDATTSDANKKIKTDNSETKTQTSCNDFESDGKVDDSKKPSGYTFLTPEKTRAICKAISSTVQSSADNAKIHTSSYVHDYLRVPRYIQTLVVPTFSFDTETGPVAKGNNGSKFKSSKQPENMKPEKCNQQQTLKGNQQIPKGTQNSVAIDTPHGWQSITPEQYSSAIASLAFPGDNAGNDCGAIGLFDHLDIKSQIEALFCDDNCKESNQSNQEVVARLKKQALKKITSSFQKCMSWSRRVQGAMSGSSFKRESSLWVPVNIFTTFLPEHVLCKSFTGIDHQSGQANKQNILVESSNVAIVGWEAFPCDLLHTKRRAVLSKLLSAIESVPSSAAESQQSSKQFALLAVNDVQSILDAAREGVSIIGTDFMRSLSCKGIALSLDFSLSTEKIKSSLTGEIDLKNSQYANDNKPILQGCTCLTCQSRKASKRPVGYQHFEKEVIDAEAETPSFSRAYIHHLIQAKEMLADTLLFIHNLHQIVLLFHKLSEARAASELEAFCEMVEFQIK